MEVNASCTRVRRNIEQRNVVIALHSTKDPALPWIYFTVGVTSVILVLTVVAVWYFKRVGFEAQLKAMNWIIEPDDLFSMEDFGLKYKQVKRDRHKVSGTDLRTVGHAFVRLQRASVHHITLLDEENEPENASSVKTARFKVRLPLSTLLHLSLVDEELASTRRFRELDDEIHSYSTELGSLRPQNIVLCVT